MGIRPAILRAAGRFALSLLPQTTVTGIDKAGSCEVRSKSFKLSSTPTSSGLLSCGGQTHFVGRTRISVFCRFINSFGGLACGAETNSEDTLPGWVSAIFKAITAPNDTPTRCTGSVSELAIWAHTSSSNQEASGGFVVKTSRDMHSVCGSCFITGFQTSRVSPNPCKNTTFCASLIYAARKNLQPG